MVLEFLLDCFLRHVLPKLSKITATCQSQLKETNRVYSYLPQVSKMSISFKLLKVSKMTSLKIYISSYRQVRNIKFDQQVNIIERVPLGTPPLAVVMTLAHNHVTNLFISSCRGATVIKFGQ